MLVTLYKISELHFRLLGTNGFHMKAKNGRFTVVGSRCRHFEMDVYLMVNSDHSQFLQFSDCN